MDEHAFPPTGFAVACSAARYNTVRRPSDRDVNWKHPVQGQSSPVQVKDLYTGSILMYISSVEYEIAKRQLVMKDTPREYFHSYSKHFR